MPIDLRKKTSVQLTGTADGNSDRDYFRVKVAANSRLQISIQNLTSSGIKLRVADALLSPITSTSKSASIYLDGGRSYFIKVQSKIDSQAGYRIELNAYASEVSAKRLSILRKGVNLPEWFWNIRGDPRKAMRTFIDARDVSMIKKLGFGHVRLPIDMKYYFDPSKPFALKSDYVGELDMAISMLESYGLGVIVCPFGDHQNWLVEGGSDREAAKAFSWTLAKYLSKYDADLTFFQTTNEPPGVGSAWQAVQTQLVSTLRDAAPKNTIITATPLYYGSGSFGSTSAFTELSTYRDTNIVYGLHFYEPFVFTHQGASWAIPGMQYIDGLSYPANYSQANAIANDLTWTYGTPNEPVVDLVRYYGIDQWNRAKLKSRLDQASAWAARNRVPMILDEFGVYGVKVDDASRYNYLSDVRTIAESAGMGWTMWDFNTEFGVLENAGSSNQTVRYDVLAALNLNTP